LINYKIPVMFEYCFLVNVKCFTQKLFRCSLFFLVWLPLPLEMGKSVSTEASSVDLEVPMGLMEVLLVPSVELPELLGLLPMVVPLELDMVPLEEHREHLAHMEDPRVPLVALELELMEVLLVDLEVELMEVLSVDLEQLPIQDLVVTNNLDTLPELDLELLLMELHPMVLASEVLEALRDTEPLLSTVEHPFHLMVKQTPLFKLIGKI
jgi:hypothetical protein